MGRVKSVRLVLATGALALVTACRFVSDEDAAVPDVEVATVESLLRSCAVADLDDATKAQIESELLPAGGAPPGSIEIDVFFHVLISLSGKGNVSNAAIQDQIRVLDDAFAATPFRFRLAGVTRTIMQSWFDMTPGSRAEATAKAALHVGSARDLNIYTASPTSGVLGWATHPLNAAGDPEADGVVVFVRSLPGGGAAPFDEGDTATHEVGHWLGLFHTFESGCSNYNDYVDDTAAEAVPAVGCPFGRNSCTGGMFPGPDPVENFMDMADDACMVLFTAGQAERMEASWLTYRSPE